MCKQQLVRAFVLCSICFFSKGAFAQKAPPFPYGPIPSAAQLNWQEMEMYCIVHFGVDTYTDKEWGFGDEDPTILNPLHFAARQIVRAAKAGGLNGILVVAKHHDGLCLWPSATTAHTIAKRPYQHGKGDFVRERENNQVKSPDALFSLYLKSVGRDADLDLGLSPNRDGQLSHGDVAALKGFGALLRHTVSTNLAAGPSIGANRLIPLQAPITTQTIRLRITKSPVCIALSDFGLFLAKHLSETPGNPLVDKYRFETSIDGQHFSPAAGS